MPSGSILPSTLATARSTLGLALLLIAAPPRPVVQVSRLDGRLRIVGSRAMAAPVARWVAAFRREHPAVRVSVALYGTGTAAAAMSDDLADVAPLTRSMSAAERALFAAPAMSPRALPLRGAGMLYLACAGGRAPTPAALEFARIARDRSRPHLLPLF